MSAGGADVQPKLHALARQRSTALSCAAHCNRLSSMLPKVVSLSISLTHPSWQSRPLPPALPAPHAPAASSADRSPPTAWETMTAKWMHVLGVTGCMVRFGRVFSWFSASSLGDSGKVAGRLAAGSRLSGGHWLVTSSSPPDNGTLPSTGVHSRCCPIAALRCRASMQ